MKLKRKVVVQAVLLAIIGGVVYEYLFKPHFEAHILPKLKGT